eukprot:6195345-Pleurochrysis_carterae.AAC.1
MGLAEPNSQGQDAAGAADVVARVVVLRMRGGGRGDDQMPARRFRISGSLPVALLGTADQQTVRELRKELRKVSQQLKALQNSFRREVDKGIRAGMRSARADEETGVFGGFAELQEE